MSMSMSMSMSARERDKKMSDMASIAADEFCKQHTDPSVSEANIRSKPEWYLEHTVPFLTVRALHRHEEALARHGNALTSLEVDSRSIKRLTRVLVGPDCCLSDSDIRVGSIMLRVWTPHTLYNQTHRLRHHRHPERQRHHDWCSMAAHVLLHGRALWPLPCLLPHALAL